MAELRLACEALMVLAAVRLVLGILPFPVAMARLGLRSEAGKGGRDCGRAPESAILAVARAVQRGSRVAPFKAVCLQQAVAAAMMLRRHGLAVEVHFGVARDEQRVLTAHAWSICRGAVITGEHSMSRYAPIAVFATWPESSQC